MSERRLEMLRRAQEQNLESGRAYTPLYAVLESRDRYRAGLLSQEALQQAVQNCQEILDGLINHLEPCPEAIFQAAEHLRLGELDELEPCQSRLEQLDLYPLLRAAEREGHRLRLQAHADLEVEQSELVAGHYRQLEILLDRWLEGGEGAEAVASCLEEHRLRIQSSLEGYESSYLQPEEWTMEVALADQLLREGHLFWLHGLELLQRSLDEDDEGLMDEGLGLLLDGNRSFVLVERLAP